jgi:hypothetical protein
MIFLKIILFQIRILVFFYFKDHLSKFIKNSKGGVQKVQHVKIFFKLLVKVEMLMETHWTSS